jgi:hypothetical protein
VSSLISDELLASLMAVGQVDVLVGLPTLNHAASVGAVVRAAHAAFHRELARQRTLLMNVDGGSTDGTPEVVRDASIDERDTFLASQSLRTRHRISTPYHGVPGKRAALRILFAAAELLDARTVVILDPEVANASAERIAALARPIEAGAADYVSPAYARHPCDGPLVTQLVRPLFRAAFGVPLREPLATERACSRAFAVHCLEQPHWENESLRAGIDLWLSAEACSADFRVTEVHTGPRHLAAHARPGIGDVVPQVLDAFCACLTLEEAAWCRDGRVPAPVAFHDPVWAQEPASSRELDGLVPVFRREMESLEPILAGALNRQSLTALTQAARDEPPRIPDAVWAGVVFQIVAAYRAARVSREHLLRAAVPAYLGRVAAFAAETRGVPAAAVAARLEELCAQFERSRPLLVELWTEAMR